MRVLFQLLDAQAAGGQRVAAGVAQILAAEGHAVGVVLPSSGPAIQLFGESVSDVHLMELGSLRDAAAVPRLTGLVQRYDVIYSHTSIPGEILAGWAAQLARRVHVIHRHTPPHLSPNASVNAFQRRAWGHVARRAKIIAVSVDTAREIRRLTCPIIDAVIISNGAPDDVAAVDAPRHSRLRVGLLGRLDPQKGMDVFLDAVGMLDDVPAVDCVIGSIPGGFERFGQDVVSRAEGLGVAMEMPVADGIAFLSDLDVVVMPSRWEGSPLTLFEAMALGKPIIASAIPGIREVVGPPDAALLVPPDDAQALASAIDHLTRSEE